MRRPSDQAKLLLLYLLRPSAAALASSRNTGGGTSTRIFAHGGAAAAVTPATPAEGPVPLPPRTTPLDGHISLRVARRSDIPSITRCNLATLPENYNPTYYMDHLRQWPDLALVAEHIPAPPDRRHLKSKKDHANSDSLEHNPQDTDTDTNADDHLLHDDDYQPKPEVIGYVLGKVEEVDAPNPARRKPYRIRGGTAATASSDQLLRDDADETLLAFFPGRKKELMGHVTSLAVLKDFRRRGIAFELMNQLHHHMVQSYQADAVGLHVRVSNRAASRLYCEQLDYGVVQVISGYYQDGEDAYLMRKDFLSSQDTHFQRTEQDPLVKVDTSLQQRPKRGIIEALRIGTALGFNRKVGFIQYRLPRDIPIVTSSTSTTFAPSDSDSSKTT